MRCFLLIGHVFAIKFIFKLYHLKHLQFVNKIHIIIVYIYISNCKRVGFIPHNTDYVSINFYKWSIVMLIFCNRNNPNGLKYTRNDKQLFVR